MPGEVRQPWETWDDEQKKRADAALKLADAIKLYRSAGGLGVNAQYAPQSIALEREGGMDQNLATTLARYRMHKELTGNDPHWQGPTNIPAGPRSVAEAPEVINARRQNFMNASPEERAKILAAQRLEVERSKEGYYDDLVGRRKGQSGS
jgi:hypothetical protein